MIKALPSREVSWRGKPVPDAFVSFAKGFHQDVFVFHATLEEASAASLHMLHAAERAALAAYLRKLLGGKYDNSDLKGLWNRVQSGMSASRGIRELFEMALKQIESGEKA
jgi:hypothetical protein